MTREQLQKTLRDIAHAVDEGAGQYEITTAINGLSARIAAEGIQGR